jgi:hypothetical protein
VKKRYEIVEDFTFEFILRYYKEFDIKTAFLIPRLIFTTLETQLTEVMVSGMDGMWMRNTKSLKVVYLS